MSTEYTLSKKAGVYLDERSSKLYLSIENVDVSPWADDYCESTEMSAREAVDMFVRGLQVTSYNMTDEEFRKAVRESLGNLSCDIYLEVR